MKRFKTILLSLVLCISLLPCGLQVSAQEEQNVFRYVVLKKINEDIKDRYIAVTLLQIGKNTTRSYYKGEQGIMFDTFILSEGNDEVINSLCYSVEYGDILEYRGSNLLAQNGTQYNDLRRIDSDGMDSFEKIGSLFDAPTKDARVRNVDGESVIVVTSAEGDTYLIYPGTPGDIRIELKLYEDSSDIGETKEVFGDFNQDNVVNASDATIILIYAAEQGAKAQTDNYGSMDSVLTPIAKNVETQAKTVEVNGDFNKDGVVNASDAATILIYSAQYGSGTFSGTFEEYVNR